MPMDYGYIELELDNLRYDPNDNPHGLERPVSQEMAKSDYYGGWRDPKDPGLHPNLVAHKMAKTSRWVEALVTQVPWRVDGKTGEKIYAKG